MIPLAVLTNRWLVRFTFLAVSVIASAGFATAVLGNNYVVLALGTANGFFWWYAADYGPPAWADGQRA